MVKASPCPSTAVEECGERAVDRKSGRIDSEIAAGRANSSKTGQRHVAPEECRCLEIEAIVCAIYPRAAKTGQCERAGCADCAGADGDPIVPADCRVVETTACASQRDRVADDLAMAVDHDSDLTASYAERACSQVDLCAA